MGIACGLMQYVWLQALFAEDTENKLSTQISKRKLILQAVGDDPPSQMAQLLALEYLVGVTDPDRLNQVMHRLLTRCLQTHLLSCIAHTAAVHRSS